MLLLTLLTNKREAGPSPALDCSWSKRRVPGKGLMCGALHGGRQYPEWSYSFYIGLQAEEDGREVVMGQKEKPTLGDHR